MFLGLGVGSGPQGVDERVAREEKGPLLFALKINRPTITELRYKGQALEFSREVKYLGIWLNDRLTWRKHVFKQINKAKANLAMLGRVVGPTWGLTPQTTKWLYEAIVLLRLTFGSIAWWETGLALKRMLGTLSTTPTRAAEIVAGMEPLDIRIKAIAMKTAHRLITWGVWKERNHGHSSLLKLEGNEHIRELISMRQDNQILKFMFQRRFQIQIGVRAKWENKGDSWKEYHQVWFTDGSRKEGVTGLGRLATVFQAEVLAIQACAEMLMEKDIKNRKIATCSDSQAALKALGKQAHKSISVMECKIKLNELARRENRLTLIWVPGHEGIKGNEMADKLANQGSDEVPIGMEPYLPMSVLTIKTAIKQWTLEERKRKWNETEGYREAKEMLGEEPRYKYARNLVALDRGKCRLMAGLLTGHAQLKLHLARMKQQEDMLCSFCEEKEESSVHVICKCPRLMNIRRKFLGKQFLEAQEVGGIKLDKLVKYITKGLNGESKEGLTGGGEVGALIIIYTLKMD
ncbi:uncharacterized protein LOC143186467 [Calliopsis andreniformis]|uniref:uncharacterized protein LOC143186467 n=1 Tax=Calliopsis andreniformis TaxID=337506 RepID=UPI003FCE8EFE